MKTEDGSRAFRRVHIRFRGGAVTSLELPLPNNAWCKRLTQPDVVARIEQLLERHDEWETAELLNAEGLCTGAGRPFDANAVRWVRYTHGLSPRTLIPNTVSRIVRSCSRGKR